MGRHSAPDGDRPADDAVTLTLARSAGLAGRHALVENVEPIVGVREADLAADDQATLVIPVDIARPEQAPESATHTPATHDGADRKAVAKRARRERKQARWQQGTGADLRLLRQNTAIRLQCIAAVVIAFGGYTAVMLGLGRGGYSYLMWAWVPIVLSGVLVGACLDFAHVRAARQPGAGGEPNAGSVSEPPECSDRR